MIPLFGDGLEVGYDEVEAISLLGMGGKMISKILNEGKDKLKTIKFILVSPQSSFKETITTLNKLGHKNIDGKYILEKRYYTYYYLKKVMKYLMNMKQVMVNIHLIIKINY